jgi:hypothetical protein
MNKKILIRGSIIIVIAVVFLLIFELGVLTPDYETNAPLYTLIHIFALVGVLLFLGGIIVLIIGLIMKKPEPEKKDSISSLRRCPDCKKIIPLEARICPFCGKKFENFP